MTICDSYFKYGLNKHMGRHWEKDTFIDEGRSVIANKLSHVCVGYKASGSNCKYKANYFCSLSYRVQIWKHKEKLGDAILYL